MSSLAKNSLLGWLLLAVLALVAVAPPGGLEVCIGEDGHVHFGADDDVEGLVCLGDGCVCPTEDHPHTDLGVEAVELVQREGHDSVLALLPDTRPAVWDSALEPPPVAVDGPPSAAHRLQPRPPQWLTASRRIVLRS